MGGVGTAPVARWVSAGVALLGVVCLLPASMFGGATGAAGLLFVLSGLIVGSRGLVSVGTGGLVVGGLVAGLLGAPTGIVILGLASGFVAWDAGQFAIDLDRTVGSGATGAVEVTHLSATGVVTVGITSVLLLADVLVTGPRPLIALIFLLIGGALCAVALGPGSLLQASTGE